MINIITGYSGPGGSTVALINLTNALNDAGYLTCMYGKDPWFCKYCKYKFSAKSLDEFNDHKLTDKDNLIVHFGKFEIRPNFKRVILCLHEKEFYQIPENSFWDECIFLNQEHRNYHSNYTGPYRIIPNLKENIKKLLKTSESKECAGVIGSIDENKQTHISIQRALDDGYKKVYLFGKINIRDSGVSYYEQYVKPLIEKYPEQVIYKGFVDNKSKMYAIIDSVYLSSISEVSPLIIDECESTDTIFRGNSVCYHGERSWNNQQILDAWIDVLQLKK
jgi:hypothetical protein